MYISMLSQNINAVSVEGLYISYLIDKETCKWVPENIGTEKTFG